MKLKPTIIGKKTFGPVIDVSDPCYDKDTWCRINDMQITPGEYTCVAWVNDLEHSCFCCGIYLCDPIESLNANRYKIDYIGVDAGLAGFFENKPDYSDDEWSEFCTKTFEKDPKTGKCPDAWIFPEGFFTRSGWGDGEYPVYKLCIDRKVIGYEIMF